MKKLSAWARARSRRRKTEESAAEREEGSSNNKDDNIISHHRAESVSSSTNGHAIPPSSPLEPVPIIQPHFLPSLPRNSNDEARSNRSGSNARIRPVLIGVSRPSDTFSRPGTAGSLQSAINWAADRIAQSPPRSPKTHSRTSSARHVDILSVTRPGVPFSLYNEDVASRNSDMSKNQYASASKYQEEVATRNAAPPLTSPTAVPFRSPAATPFTSPTATSAGEPKPVLNFTKPRTGAPLEVYREQGAHTNAECTQKPSEAEAAAHHEDRDVKEHAGGLSAPQSLPEGEQSPATAPATRGTLQRVNVPHNEPNLNPQQAINPLDGPIAKNENRRPGGDAPLPKFSPTSPLSPLPSNKTAHIDAAAKLSPSHKLQSELTTETHHGKALSVGQSSASKLALTSETVPSSSANAFYLRKTIIMSPNNTLIDSAGDDSEAMSDESFTSASAGIWDDSSKLQASRADSAGDAEPGSDYTYYSGSNDVTSRLLRSVEPEQQGSPESTIQHTPPSSFSPIKILASLLPASQQETQPGAKPILEISAVGTEGRKPILNKLYTVAETEPEVEDSPTRVGGEKPGALPSPPASPTDTSQPESSQTTPTQVKPAPHESQWPSDLTDPNGPYGIRTRDFAVSPRKEAEAASGKMSSRRGDPTPATNAAITSFTPEKEEGTLPNRIGLTPVTPVKTKAARMSVFNEEAFMRKQEQARAALIKLQHSLNEDFENMPPQAMYNQQAQTNGVNRYSNSSSSTDGRPHAPPPTHRIAASQVNGTYQIRDTSLARTSLSISDPPTSPRSISSMSSSVRPLDRHSPMHSLQETAPRLTTRRRRETNPVISEMRRLVYEMTQPRPVVPNQYGYGSGRSYEPSLSSFALTPEEVSLSSFPLPVAPLSSIPGETARPDSLKEEQEEDEPLEDEPFSYSQHHHQHHQQHKHAYPFSYEPYDMEAAPAPVIRSYSTSPSRSRRHQKSAKKSGHTKTPSNASQHSIPSHLIPDRGSSMRDASVAGDD